MRGAAAAFAQLGTIGVIDKAVRDIELGIERKQERQSRRADGIDILVLAAIPPDPPQPLIALAMLAQHHRRRVMQEAAEGAAAEGFIFAGVENELVPEIVG